MLVVAVVVVVLVVVTLVVCVVWCGVQVDFASRECQNVFLEGLEKTGQLRTSSERERYFTEYSTTTSSASSRHHR